jgi:hypothetical protein
MFLASFGVAQGLAASDPANPDWPCVQRKVPSISAGAVWGGPEIRNEDRSWEEQPDIADLVRRISSRRMPLEEAFAAIDSFATASGADRNGRLTLLFTGMLQTVNAERLELMQGIERYTRRQRELAAKINAERAELDALRAREDPGGHETAKIQDLQKAFEWDTRVFRERQESLAFVCESPVLLEQRLFALARHVESLLE